jgi:hypothetical protein
MSLMSAKPLAKARSQAVSPASLRAFAPDQIDISKFEPSQRQAPAHGIARSSARNHTPNVLNYPAGETILQISVENLCC